MSYNTAESDLVQAGSDTGKVRAAKPRLVQSRVEATMDTQVNDEAEHAQVVASRLAAAAEAARQASIAVAMTSLISSRGRRYAECRLSNFRCYVDAQSRAVAKLRSYLSEITEHAATGFGVCLFGPCGSGKDHLAWALASGFIRKTGKRVEWASGAILFEQLRNSFQGKKSESEVMDSYRTAPLLWLSDPLPVNGDLTQYQNESLYRLLDARYSACKPVLITANLEPGKADVAFGPAIARRLRESTLPIHCNWGSFKQSH